MYVTYINLNNFNEKSLVMCGICCTIDKTPRTALNELLNNDLISLEGLDKINETELGSKLIPTECYEVIKTYTKDKDQSRIFGMNPGNLKKLNELALIKSSMWLGYTELKVHILPHTFDPNIDKTIEVFSNEWVPYSGIKFVFVNALPADIIIQLNGNGIHSSQIGTDSINFSSKNQPTMNLGIGGQTLQEFIRRPIIHEFGHALGCMHEHQSPAGNIQWNEAVVIRTLKLQGWDEDKVRHNILNKLSNTTITNSAFDAKSIMIYPIPEDFTTNRFSVGWNTELSDQDKAFMKLAYSV
ncbi:MAG: hypothetical protein K0R26_1952 [Bacteroidota bacterium]|jgi:hypothetical protein|nr:hypothetical protein [Bacteroidota bacterium]